MKTFKRMAATVVVMAGLMAAAVLTGYVTVAALPVAVPVALLIAYHTSK